MEQNQLHMSFKKIGWSFKEILDVAKDIKPSGWIVVANKCRLAFMEVSLGQQGPVAVEKQLVLDQTLELEAYIGGQKVEEGLFRFKLSKIRSARELYVCLKLFASYGICQGNKNFKRINKNSEINDTDYWKDTNCHKVYDKSLRRPENCCDACLQLNHLLPKKINNMYLSLSQPTLYKSIVKNHLVSNTELSKMERHKSVKRKKIGMENEIKKIKQEVEEAPCIPQFVTVKVESSF